MTPDGFENSILFYFLAVKCSKTRRPHFESMKFCRSIPKQLRHDRSLPYRNRFRVRVITALFCTRFFLSKNCETIPKPRRIFSDNDHNFRLVISRIKIRKSLAYLPVQTLDYRFHTRRGEHRLTDSIYLDNSVSRGFIALVSTRWSGNYDKTGNECARGATGTIIECKEPREPRLESLTRVNQKQRAQQQRVLVVGWFFPRNEMPAARRFYGTFMTESC